MRLATSMILVFVTFVPVGCGGDDGGSVSCPPEFPVMRDGICYRDGDGGLVASDAGSTTSDAGGSSGDAGGDGTDGGPPACMGRHPNVEGMRRFCDPGECFCADPDACFAATEAAACCNVDVVCEPDVDAGVACMGRHPNVADGRRFCDPGECFCADPDACFPAASAAACCDVDVVCE